jgi:cytoskeletal protein CcmA (bactofilin family)
LIIRKNGRVTGKVAFAEIEIERGGQISGDVELLNGEASNDDTQSRKSDATS